MATETGFMKTETKTPKTNKVKTPITAATRKPRAAKTARAVKTAESIKVVIPRNPREAFELGKLMARYQ